MQHELHHGDFQQGKTLANLIGERAVQNWTADRLAFQARSIRLGRAREVHVADEKEPDIRLRAKATDASVPVEIKIAQSWKLEELESALKDQLCGKYLRAKDGRHGILLLVYQAPKPGGWPDHVGKALTFSEVVSHLRAMAVAISAAAFDAPQPEIAILDVSSFTEAKAANDAKKAARAVKKKTRKTSPS